MAFNAPNRERGLAYRKRFILLEQEFRHMLIEQMEKAQFENRKRVTDYALQKLEYEERHISSRAKRANMFAKEIETAVAMKSLIDPSDKRSALMIQDYCCNVTHAYLSPPASPLQIDSAALKTITTSANAIDNIPAGLLSSTVQQIQPPPPTKRVREWPLSAWLIEHNQIVGNLKQLKQLGSFVAEKYREVNGKEPIKRINYVDGAARRVNHYTDTDVSVIKAGIEAMRIQTGWPPVKSTLNNTNN